MLMIRAIVRPEKSDDILAALMDAGFPAVTKYSRLDAVNNVVLKSVTSPMMRFRR